MREIIAQIPSVRRYSDPDTAIRKSIQVDARERTISDQEVSGSVILKMSWSDSALVLELEGHRFLNCIAIDNHIACTMSERAVGTSNEADDTILLKLNTTDLEWKRSELAERYTGKIVDHLWFGEGSILIYVQEMPILACHILKGRIDGNPILFWTESD